MLSCRHSSHWLRFVMASATLHIRQMNVKGKGHKHGQTELQSSATSSLHNKSLYGISRGWLQLQFALLYLALKVFFRVLKKLKDCSLVTTQVHIPLLICKHRIDCLDWFCHLWDSDTEHVEMPLC